jgi:hypothetical protein
VRIPIYYGDAPDETPEVDDLDPGSTPPLSSRDTVPVDEEDADGEM